MIGMLQCEGADFLDLLFKRVWGGEAPGPFLAVTIQLQLHCLRIIFFFLKKDIWLWIINES